MSEMVERVARAIWNADIAVAGNQPISDMSWDEMWSSRRRELLEPPALAAIAAMREPTEAMLRVPELQDADDVAYVWHKMIDSALK